MNNVKAVVSRLAVGLFVCWLTSISLASGSTGDPLIHTAVMTFPTEDLWEARQNLLLNVGDGHLRSEGPSPLYASGNCGDLLQNFQESRLKKMLADGYINQETFDTLMKLTQNGISATQLVLFTQYSDVTFKEARELFGGSLPKDRSMGPVENGLV